jgi:hypothetical protein
MGNGHIMNEDVGHQCGLLVTSFSRILIFWAPISTIGDLFFPNPDFLGANPTYW